MEDKNILDEITRSLAEIDFEANPIACKDAIAANIPSKEIIDALSKGMNIIGKKFEVKEYFLSELIMAGEMFREAQEIIGPYIKKGDVKVPGKVVIGTVEGDLHDIGKNIVVVLLRAKGFEVTDLGVNVPSNEFIDAVRKDKPDVLGMSALLRATVPQMSAVIKQLEKKELRDSVKVIVGGLPLNEEYAKRLGADYYAKDAWLGVGIIKKAVETK
jgi:5-methyltetrahydrofolate--homocysteine methyltransferase